MQTTCEVDRVGAFHLAHRPGNGYYNISVERGRLSPDPYSQAATRANGR
jgi:hypothetical protein